MVESITIAQILKPQGIRGEIKVKCLLDSPSDIKKYKIVEIDGNSYQILSARADATAGYINLSGVYDRDCAEKLRGKFINVLRENAPTLEKDSFYIVDILGSSLKTEEGKILGKIVDIYSASVDVYVVENADKKLTFPRVDGLILKIDIENKEVIVNAKRLQEVLLIE